MASSKSDSLLSLARWKSTPAHTTKPRARAPRPSSSPSRRLSPWSQPSRKRPLPPSCPDGIIDLTDDNEPEQSEREFALRSWEVGPAAPKPPSPPLLNVFAAGAPHLRAFPSQMSASTSSPTPSTSPPQPMVTTTPPISVSPGQEPIEIDTPTATGATGVQPPTTMFVSSATSPAPPGQTSAASLALSHPSLPPTPSGIDQVKFEHERPESTYLRHFKDAIETVMHARPDYAGLFTPEERETVERFDRLSTASKNLYVRLFQRKGPWFRADGMMGYDEVGSAMPLWLRRLRAAEVATIAADPSAASAAALEDVGGRMANGTDVRRGKCDLDAPRFPSSPFAPAKEEATIEKCAEQQNSVMADDNIDKLALPQPEDVMFSPQELTVLHAEIQSALHELIGAGFLSPLPDNIWRAEGPGLEAALAGVNCCLRSVEITTLLKRTSGGRAKTLSRPQAGVKSRSSSRPSSAETATGSERKRGRGTVKSEGNRVKDAGPLASAVGAAGREGGRGDRRGMIAELRQRLTGQQTLWGAKLPLVNEIESLVSSSVERLGVDVVEARRRAECGGIRNAGCETRMVIASDDSGPQRKQRLHWLVRIADIPRLVFKRALRLLYLTCDTNALSSGRVGASSVRGAGVPGAISSWSPGLSAAFGKARYASYTCHVRARAFERRKDFLRWEAAVELRCALDGAMADLPRGWAEALMAAGSDNDDDEQSDPGLSVIDGKGIEETIVKREQKNKHAVRASLGEQDESHSMDDAAGTADVGALEGLEEFIDQFLSAEEKAVVVSADVTAIETVASPAITLALTCARCLRAHLGTHTAALNAQALSVIVGTRHKAAADQATELIEEEALLDMLKEICSGEYLWDSGERIYTPGGKSGSLIPPSAATTMEGTNGVYDRSVHANHVSDNDKQKHGGESASSGRDVAIHSEGSAAPKGGPLRSPSPGYSLCRAERQGLDQQHFEHGVEEVRRESDDNEIAGDGGLSSRKGSIVTKRDGGGEVPEFLLQLDAGWVLASAVWEGVMLLEKARDYGRAVELVAQLLATRYTPHRRGRWWYRLSLDLVHAGRVQCALWASEEGLKDPRVRGGDRLALEKRTTMLRVRIFNNFFKATRASATAGVSAGLSSSLSHHDTLGASSTGSQSGAAKSPLCDDEEGTVLRCAFSGNFHALDIDDDADGDVFEDPAVEREKRRKRKQRRRAWQSRTAAANATRDLGVVRADSSARVDRVNEKMLPSPEDTNDESEGISQATLAEQCPKSVTCRRPVDVAITSPRDKECASRSGGLDEAATDSGKISDRDNFVNRHGNSNHEGVGKREPGLVQALAIKSAELAELSEVPNLLRDESVGAVVLAATTTTAVSTEDIAKTGETGQEKRCGVGIFGVPEMTITGRRLNREVGIKSRYVGYGDGAACTVESLVLQHLSQQDEGGWAGWHCEGSPLRGLWALLMWDVMFMDLPDVFQTPFQDAPLDVDFCPLFYLNRRDAIDARLEEIRAASPVVLAALVAEAWSANEGTVCRGLRWDRTSARYLQAVAIGLGGKAVAATLAALCLNFKHFGGGLPDLLLMRAVRTTSGEEANDNSGTAGATSAAAILDEQESSTPGTFASWLGVESGAIYETKVFNDDIIGGNKTPTGVSTSGNGGGGGRNKVSSPLPPPFGPSDLVGLRLETWLLEVKGPTDRLSDRQTAWLRILLQGGARVGVCHVSEGQKGSHVSVTDASGGVDPNMKAESKRSLDL